MKNILLISRCPPYPLHLGDRLIIWHLTRELAGRGYQLDLLAYAQYASDWNEVNHYASYFRSVKILPEPRRSNLSYLRRLLVPFARWPRQACAAWSPQMWKALAAQLTGQDYDVVHLFGGVQVYEFAHLLRNQATVITPYESYSLYLKRLIANGSGMKRRVQRWGAKHYERWMFKPYTRTTVVAQPDKDELLRTNSKLKIEVVSNGIDLDYFMACPVQRDAYTLLFVGNYEYPPNLDAAMYLVQTLFPQIQRRIPQARLQIVGHAPPSQLRALQSERIEVTGRVPDVRPYLRRATVFICPLRTGAGIKNKVLEAMAMGIPVVATPISVDGIAVQHEESLLIAETSYIVDETIRLLQTPDLQATLAKNGRACIENQYSWSKVAEDYLRVYAAAIQS